MKHPAVAIVIGFGGFSAGLREIFHQVEQRLMTFGEIAHFSRPVVHFQIDVGGIFTSPGRQGGFTPYSLKVCRLTACATAGSQNITTELEYL